MNQTASNQSFPTHFNILMWQICPPSVLRDNRVRCFNTWLESLVLLPEDNITPKRPDQCPGLFDCCTVSGLLTRQLQRSLSALPYHHVLHDGCTLHPLQAITWWHASILGFLHRHHDWSSVMKGSIKCEQIKSIWLAFRATMDDHWKHNIFTKSTTCCISPESSQPMGVDIAAHLIGGIRQW